jgi:hypothetical protein
VERPSTTGVRVSGGTNATGARLIYISGTSGAFFNDGTFEFQDVPPGRHSIATVNNPAGSTPLGASVVVGNQSVDGIRLEDILLLPPDARTPVPPLPAGDRPPGSTVPMARLTGTLVEDVKTDNLDDATLFLKNGSHSVAVLLDSNRRFEVPALLPGTYTLQVHAFGHQDIYETVVIDDRDVNLSIRLKRLY